MGSHKSCIDHKGISYRSKLDMVAAYGVAYKTFTWRIRQGYSLVDALTGPKFAGMNTNGKEVTDHLGVTYKSISAMARSHGMCDMFVRQRLCQGWSIERALTTPAVSKGVPVKDHLGNDYISINAMCKSYDIPRRTYSDRIISGWELEAALTTPSLKPEPKPEQRLVYTTRSPRSRNLTTDHLGNNFNSWRALCIYHDISYSLFRARVGRYQFTVREAIFTIIHGNRSNISQGDTSLNKLIAIHEYSHTVELTGDRVFRCTIIETGETKYMNENQVRKFPEGWL